MVLKIGITGGIGSGKSTIAKIFGLLDVPIYYADAATKNLYHTNKNLKESLKQHFGDDIYINGLLNKSLLASIIFNDPVKLELLNSLVHPITHQDAENWMAKQKAPYVIKEAALLFESGSARTLDYIIGVYSPKHVRLKRAMQRDNASKDEILHRMDRQIDEDIKMKLCDFIIINNEQQMIIPQVIKLHQHFLSLINMNDEVK
jgi:dephospho-CoA kinase